MKSGSQPPLPKTRPRLEKIARRICGHIMPLGYPQRVSGLRQARLTDARIMKVRIEGSAVFLPVVLYRGWRAASWLYERKLRRYRPEVCGENAAVVPKTNRLDLLTSRSCVNESGRSANFAATVPAAPSGQPSGWRLGHNSDFGFPSDFASSF